MKNRYFILCLCLMPALLFPATTWCDDIDAQKAGIRFAAKQAARVAVEELINKDPQKFTNTLAHQILTNIQDHQTKEKSRKKGRAFLHTWLQVSFQEDISKLHRSLNPQDSPDRWFTEEWLEDQVEKNLKHLVDDNIEIFSTRHYPAEFEEARTSAVKSQLGKISRMVYPPFEKVDFIANEGWKSTQVSFLKWAVQNDMLMQINGPLLDEVQKSVDTLLDDIFKHIRRQFDNQNQALEIRINPEVITPDDICISLEENVIQEIQRMRQTAGKDRIIYSIFSSVKETIKSKGKSMAEERFQAYCRNYDYAVSQEKLQGKVSQALSQHHFFEESLKLCTQQYFDKAKEDVLRAYAAPMQEGTQKDRFTSFLNNSVNTHYFSIEAVKNGLRNSMRGILRNIHTEIAKAQMGKYFEAINDWTWQVPEPTLKKITFQNFGVHTFEHCTSIPFVISRNYPEGSLLEKTENLVLKRTQKLLSEGERAWDGQNGLVEKYKDIIRVDIAENPDKKSLQQWGDYYQGKVREEWAKKRIHKIWRGVYKVPDCAGDKYSELFGYFRQKIHEYVKAYFKVAKEEQKRRERERLILEAKRKLEEERRAKKALEERRAQRKLAEERETQRLEEIKAKREQEEIKAKKEQEEMEAKRKQAEMAGGWRLGKQSHKATEGKKEPEGQSLPTLITKANNIPSLDSLTDGKQGGEKESGNDFSDRDGEAVAGGSQDQANEKGGGISKGPSNKGGQGKPGTHKNRAYPWLLIFLIILIILLIIALLWLLLIKRTVTLHTYDLSKAKTIFKELFGLEPVRETQDELEYKVDFYKILIRLKHPCRTSDVKKKENAPLPFIPHDGGN